MMPFADSGRDNIPVVELTAGNRWRELLDERRLSRQEEGKEEVMKRGKGGGFRSGYG
jgi:hypothetical protein